MNTRTVEVTQMHDLTRPDRRLQSNRTLSIVVDVGVVCHASLGQTTAKLLFLAHDVPSTVAARVLFHTGERRVTELERAADEVVGERNQKMKCANEW